MLQALGPAISGFISHPALQAWPWAETGRKAGAVTQWLRATEQNNARDRSGSTKPFWSSGKTHKIPQTWPAYQAHPKERGGKAGGLERDTGTTVYWGSLLRSLHEPMGGFGPLLFSCILCYPGCRSTELQKQFLSVSLDHFLLCLPGCTVCIILSRVKWRGFSLIKQSIEKWVDDCFKSSSAK